MREHADRSGQQLGNYLLLQLLGRGGFAEVYLGEHRYLRTRAAVKVLHTQLAQEDVESFLREAQTVARLKHFHIVRVLDFGVEDGTPFLVMDYAPNGTLRQRHPRGMQVPLNVVVTYTQQVAEALQYAHDQRLVHRDVKPENMLIGEKQEILLSDFGIALSVQSSSTQSPQNIAGSIAYMAPEQIQAHPRPASDQYALGITAYEWLSGNRPFDGAYTEIAVKHTMAPPPPLRQWIPTLPPTVEEVVMRSLAKDPHQRFVTVRAFAQALAQASSPTYQHTSQSYFSTAPLTPSIPMTPARSTSLLASYSTQIPLAAPPIAQPSHSFSPSNTPQPYPFPGATPYVQTPMPYPYTSAKQARPVSRRFVLTSILGVAAVSSGITWFVASRPQGVLPSLKVTLPGFNLDPTVPDIFTPSSAALVTYRGHSDYIWSVDWSPDGNLVTSGSKDGTAQVWSAKDGTHLFSYPPHPASPSSNDWAYSVKWANDSQRVATSFSRGSAVIWNASTGKSVGTYSATPVPGSQTIAWSPDNKYIAVGRFDNTVTIYDVGSGKATFTYTDHQDSVTTIAWSYDGQRIASGSQDGIIKVWRPSDGHLFFNFLDHKNVSDAGGDVRALAWSHDSQYIASCGSGVALVWETKSGYTLIKYDQHVGGLVNTVAWSHHDTYVATGGNDITTHIWHPLTAQLAHKLPSGVIFGVAWAPDDTRIVTANFNKVAQIWQINK